MTQFRTAAPGGMGLLNVMVAGFTITNRLKLHPFSAGYMFIKVQIFAPIFWVQP